MLSNLKPEKNDHFSILNFLCSQLWKGLGIIFLLGCPSVCPSKRFFVTNMESMEPCIVEFWNFTSWFIIEKQTRMSFVWVVTLFRGMPFSKEFIMKPCQLNFSKIFQLSAWNYGSLLLRISRCINYFLIEFRRYLSE